ncbi:MAG TPA: type II toxin-antitoxin system VapC family toxin [Verrucomicrobiae bacterium]|nr:type II toxin-antitoxin system VapC family toxin [Verrucomicrobiae bacterium]
MIAFPDTSFLCALYVRQVNSPEAAAHVKGMTEALHVSGLMLYEFRQSVRFQVWLHARDKSKGYPQTIADAALEKLQANMEASAVVPVSADWPDVHRLAETLSKRHTMAGGHRAFDVLHVATALHLGAREFLTFDANQRKLAAAEKLKVKP